MSPGPSRPSPSGSPWSPPRAATPPRPPAAAGGAPARSRAAAGDRGRRPVLGRRRPQRRVNCTGTLIDTGVPAGPAQSVAGVGRCFSRRPASSRSAGTARSRPRASGRARAAGRSGATACPTLPGCCPRRCSSARPRARSAPRSCRSATGRRARGRRRTPARRSSRFRRPGRRGTWSARALRSIACRGGPARPLRRRLRRLRRRRDGALRGRPHTAALPASATVEDIGGGAVIVRPHLDPPELSTVRFTWGPRGEVDCTDKASFHHGDRHPEALTEGRWAVACGDAATYQRRKASTSTRGCPGVPDTTTRRV